MQPETFFPRLPDRALTADATWQSQSHDGWAKYRLKASPPVAGSQIWSFEVRKRRTAGYGLRFVERVVRNLRSRTRTCPQGDVTKSGGWLARCRYDHWHPRADSERGARRGRVAAVGTRGRDLFSGNRRGPTAARRSRSGLQTHCGIARPRETVFASLDEQLRLPLLRHNPWPGAGIGAKSRASSIEEAELFAKQLDQPSADWQTTDLEGARHARKTIAARWSCSIFGTAVVAGAFGPCHR